MTLKNNRFVTGYGMGDTHALEVNDKEAGAKKPNLSRSAGKPYETISFNEIAKMAEAPIATKKQQAQWAIFSNYNRYDARSHDCQRANGEFWVLPVDLDKGAPDLETLVTIIKAAVGDVEALIYSSRSATLETPKWRVLIPLAKSIEGSAYQATQRALFDLLNEGGLTCDRALERTGQLVYLPNRGDYYAHQRLTGGRLDPTDGPLAVLVAANRKAEERRLEEVRRVLSEQPPRSLDFDDSDNPMTWYNANHRLTDVLFAFGYTQDGASVHWRSPLQQSESFATMVDGERWVSLSSSDISAELGRVKDGQVTSGDAYDIYVHFAHGGDHAKAYKAIREMMPTSPRQHQNDLSDFEIVPFANEPSEFLPSEAGSEFFVASEWADKPVPERQWLVDQWIPERQVSSLYGDGGVGKSLLALQAAMCVASGCSWLGLPTKAGPALFITAEDDTSELHIRAAALAAEMGLDLGALSDLHIRSLAGEDAVLGTFDRSGKLAATPLFARVKEYVTQTRPVLVVFDTLADLFAGTENDRTQARQFVGLLRGLALKDECAVLLLAHPSLTGMASGSGSGGNTAWNNSVRSRLYLERVKDEGYEPNPDQRTLRQMKANYAKAFGEIRLTYVRGAFVADNPGTFLDRKAHLAKAERVFLSLLRSFNEQGRRVNHSGARTYAPKVFAELTEAEGCTKKVLGTAMNTLLQQGKIVIKEDGPPSKRSRFLVVSERN
jgi:RecA-family ATPase